MAFQIGSYKNPADAKKAAIEAAKAAAAGRKPEDGAMVRYIPPGECQDRIRIVFDDSGSMAGEIDNAKKGVVEFLRNCIPNQTAVAVHFMNTTEWSTELRSNLPQLGVDVQEAFLSSGGTPFFNTIKRALESTPKLTRLVAFTDGAPTDRLQAEEDENVIASYYSFNRQQGWLSSADVVIKIAHYIGGEKCIPIDTIYFGPATDYTAEQIALLKYLAEKTGGFFLHFDPAKVSFKTAFKYLAPVNRLQLTSGSFRASLERGEVK